VRLVFPSLAFAAVLVAGCVALSPEERRQLGLLAKHGYGVDAPPDGFTAPVDVWTAAGLNALPGVGNFYLGCKGGGEWQWALGVANLLLWPISPCWAVAKSGWDARSLNKRALLEFCRKKAKEGSKLPPRSADARVTGKLTDKSASSSTSAKSGMELPKASAPYEIVTEEPFSRGRAVYRVDIADPSMTAFDVVKAVRPEIEAILRDAFATEMPGLLPDSIRVYVVPEFGENRTIRLRGWAFAAKPVADAWQYNSETRRGVTQFRLFGGMPPEEAKQWARENIEAIVKEKNVALQTGGMPPEGAVYRSLGESLENGVLTVEFEAVE